MTFQSLNNPDYTINLNFSRFNSINWNSINEELSMEASNYNKSQNHLVYGIFSEPPRPTNNIYSCIENGDSNAEEIKEVPYLSTET